MECCFCNRVYSTKQVLKHHKATSKKCIAIQLERNPELKKDAYVCTYCDKELSTKNRLGTHMLICKKSHIKTKDDLEKELSKKDEEIKELKEKLSKTPPKVSIKNNINNIEQQNNITIYQVMSPDHVENFFKKHYNLDTLLGGQKALARFVNDGFLKESPVYLCGDRSRQKFYIVKDGKKTEDTDCDQILGLTTPGMPHVQEVYETALFNDLPEKITEEDVQDNYQQIMTLDENRADFKAELSKIISTTSEKPTFKEVIRALKNRSEKLGLTEKQSR
jgi:hypothetical protein